VSSLLRFSKLVYIDLQILSDSSLQDKYCYIAIKKNKRIDFYKTEYQPNKISGGFWAPKKSVFERETILKAIKTAAKQSIRTWKILS